MLPRRLSIDEIVHAFRPPIRNWAGKHTNVQPNVAEMALAHLDGEVTGNAHCRKEALDSPSALLEDRPQFCNQEQ